MIVTSVCKFYVLKLVVALISQCGVDSLLSGVYIMEFLTFKWEALYEFRISWFDSMLNDWLFQKIVNIIT